MSQPILPARVFTFLSDDIKAGHGVEPGQRGFELELPGIGDLSTRVKVYIEGGENAMHSHPREDHMFFILSGSATFHIETDDNAVDIGVNEAVTVPRGTKYWFTNTVPTPLVILRIGNGEDANYRLDANGNEFAAIPPTNAVWRRDEGRALV